MSAHASVDRSGPPSAVLLESPLPPLPDDLSWPSLERDALAPQEVAQRWAANLEEADSAGTPALMVAQALLVLGLLRSGPDDPDRRSADGTGLSLVRMASGKIRSLRTCAVVAAHLLPARRTDLRDARTAARRAGGLASWAKELGTTRLDRADCRPTIDDYGEHADEWCLALRTGSVSWSFLLLVRDDDDASDDRSSPWVDKILITDEHGETVRGREPLLGYGRQWHQADAASASLVVRRSIEGLDLIDGSLGNPPWPERRMLLVWLLGCLERSASQPAGEGVAEPRIPR